MMTGNEINLSLSLFVEQGQERSTAEFYKAVFGAEEVNCYEMLRLLMIELQLGPFNIVICGSDPKHEAAPSYSGPFYPKTQGAVSTIFQLTVPDVGEIVNAAIEAGGMIRDPVQTDLRDREVASIFDPGGHIWVLIGQPHEAEANVSDQAGTPEG